MISDIALPHSPRSIIAMLALLLIAVQAGPPAPVAPPPRIDLTPLTPPPQRCGSGEDGEIVVCARRADADRLVRIPDRYVEPRLRPEAGVLGGKASARAEQRGTLSGSAPALMLDFKLPF